MLDDNTHRWRKSFEERMDRAHDACLARHGKAWHLDDDVKAHVEWSERKRGASLSDAEVADI